jgi:hypothetical protein
MDLSNRALLVDLHISAWPGLKTDQRATVEVQQFNKATKDSGKYQKFLCRAGGLLTKIHNKGVEVRNLHKTLTAPWEDQGKRVISTDLYITKYRSAVISAVSELQGLYPEFNSKYPELVEADREIHGDMWKLEDYPTVVASSFDVEMSASPIPAVKDFRLDMSEELAKELQESYERDINRKLAAVTKDAWERLAESTRRLHSAVSGYGPGKRLFSSLFTNLEDTATVLQGLNLSNNAQLNSLADEVKELVRGLVVDNLKESPESRTVLSNQFQSVLDKMNAYI